MCKELQNEIFSNRFWIGYLHFKQGQRGWTKILWIQSIEKAIFEQNLQPGDWQFRNRTVRNLDPKYQTDRKTADCNKKYGKEYTRNNKDRQENDKVL